jgi:hypothetical protein
MAPFMREHCPVCSAETWQHFLLPGEVRQDGDGDLLAICESCLTILMHGKDGLIGQRPSTAQERATLEYRTSRSRRTDVRV